MKAKRLPKMLLFDLRRWREHTHNVRVHETTGDKLYSITNGLRGCIMIERGSIGDIDESQTTA